jgi:hypothetical protein
LEPAARAADSTRLGQRWAVAHPRPHRLPDRRPVLLSARYAACTRRPRDDLPCGQGCAERLREREPRSRTLVRGYSSDLASSRCRCATRSNAQPSQARQCSGGPQVPRQRPRQRRGSLPRRPPEIAHTDGWSRRGPQRREAPARADSQPLDVHPGPIRDGHGAGGAALRVPLDGVPSRAAATGSSSAATTCSTALINPRWVNACGKLPSWRPLTGSISSA